MEKAFSFALLLGGSVLVMFGLNASQSLGAGSRLFTRVPADNPIWMQVGGVVLFIFGLVSLMGRRQRA